MEIFHGCFDAELWEFRFGKLFDGVFMDGPSYSSSDCDERAGFPSLQG